MAVSREELGAMQQSVISDNASQLLMTPREAALALAVCEATLRSYTKPRGDLPCVRIGRAVRYDVRDLRTWIDGRKGNPENN